MTRYLPIIVLALVVVAGCGSDDDPPTTPPDPAPSDDLRVPEDYATVADALAAVTDTLRTVSLAAGEYTMTLSLDRTVTLRSRPGETGLVRLVDSRLTVRAAAGDTVTLHGLVMAGGDTLLTVPGAATVLADSCRFQEAELGILHTGGGVLSVRGTRIHHCMGQGAIHAHDANRFDLMDCLIDQCDSGEAGVLRATGSTVLNWRDNSLSSCQADQAVINLEDTAGGVIDELYASFCTPYTVRHRGGALTLRDAWFEFVSGTPVGVGQGSRLTVDACRFLFSRWPAVEVGGEATIAASVVYDGFGMGGDPAFLVGNGGQLTASNCTVHQGPGPLLDLGDGATADLDGLLATELAVPMVVGVFGGLSMDSCDLWLAAGGAWAGLEAVRDAGTGNVELDPLYCDGDSFDLNLQDGTPVAGLGALGVGCD